MEKVLDLGGTELGAAYPRKAEGTLLFVGLDFSLSAQIGSFQSVMEITDEESCFAFQTVHIWL
jgi:hypothetical protein